MALTEGPTNVAGGGALCPDTHFLCPSSGHCLPVFALCNRVYDCPGHEDEADCARFTCRGHYRCRSSRVCLHPAHVCDGLQHCPEHDDELLCHHAALPPPCPPGCVCHGLALLCARGFPAHRHPELRYLHAAGTGLTLSDVTRNVMLVHLGLARNGIRRLGDDVRLANLRSLDLSDNLLGAVSVRRASAWPQLRALSLAGNPLGDAFFADTSPPPRGRRPDCTRWTCLEWPSPGSARTSSLPSAVSAASTCLAAASDTSPGAAFARFFPSFARSTSQVPH